MSELLNELSAQFPTEQKTPFGPCIIVPQKSFKSEWEDELRGEGYKTFMQARNGETCVFIRLAHSKFRKHWNSREVEQLKELVSLGLSHSEIASKLGRTKISVQGKIQRMSLSGLPQAQPTDTPNPSANMEVGTVKEFLSAVSLLYPSHRQAAAFLLRECADKILGEQR